MVGFESPGIEPLVAEVCALRVLLFYIEMFLLFYEPSVTWKQVSYLNMVG